jgi:hypothetical protein
MPRSGGRTRLRRRPGSKPASAELAADTQRPQCLRYGRHGELQHGGSLGVEQLPTPSGSPGLLTVRSECSLLESRQPLTPAPSAAGTKAGPDTDASTFSRSAAPAQTPCRTPGSHTPAGAAHARPRTGRDGQRCTPRRSRGFGHDNPSQPQQHNHGTGSRHRGTRPTEPNAGPSCTIAPRRARSWAFRRPPHIVAVRFSRREGRECPSFAPPPRSRPP